jgi:hypothetical protein
MPDIKRREFGEDPVKEGLVPSFNRPGGNVTGFSNFGNQLGAKKLGILHDTVTKAAVVGLLVNPTNPNAEPDTHDAQAAAGALGLELRAFTASTEDELEPAFAAMEQLRVGGLLVVHHAFRWRGGWMAPRGSRAAARTLPDRSPRHRGSDRYPTAAARQLGRIHARATRGRIHRGTEHCIRAPIRARPTRAVPQART